MNTAAQTTVPIPATRTENEIFASFHLSDSQFAISITYVQEVVNPPETYDRLPLGPHYLLGLFNLRGTVIPVVDLAAFLGLPKVEGPKRVAIIDFDGHSLGLLLDSTGEIFRSHEQERSDFRERGGEGVVEGVFKLDHGKRLVQILDLAALFNLKGLPKTGDQLNRHRQSAGARGARKQCISFSVGGTRCGVPIADIYEILKSGELKEPASFNGSYLGAMELRGIMVPIVDFAALLNYRAPISLAALTDPERRIIVLRLEREIFGLLVDGVDSITAYYENDLRPLPLSGSGEARLFDKCLSLEGQPDTLLLDVKSAFTEQETARLTQGHSQIYQARRAPQAEAKASRGERRTFITFRIDAAYAIAIEDIKEIIDPPPVLLRPPGFGEAILGVLNLRGEMVLIVDGRSLYGLPAKPRDGAEKVLIFKQGDLHFGLVVDYVDAIRAFSNDEVNAMPDFLRPANTTISADIADAVMMNSGKATEASMLILKIAAITQRVEAAGKKPAP
jgi:purine-binding chemotaxis protein CheW